MRSEEDGVVDMKNSLLDTKALFQTSCGAHETIYFFCVYFMIICDSVLHNN
jgi:hypothetical protein